MRLYISNLAEEITDDDLRRAFNKYKIRHFERAQGSNNSTFAIVKVEDGEQAIKDMNGIVVRGCPLQIVPAVDRKKQCKDVNR